MPIPLIGAAIAGGGSLLGGLLGGRQSSQEKALEAQEASNAATGGKFGSEFLTSAQGNLNSAQNFWQSILNGNQGSTATALAPTINNINSQSAAAEKSALEFTPRGGGQSEIAASIPYQRANAVTGAITNLAAQAPNELAQIGTAEGSLGTSALSGSTASSASALNFLQGQSQQAIQTGTQVGQGLGNLLYYFLNAQSAGGGGSGSPYADVGDGIPVAA